MKVARSALFSPIRNAGQHSRHGKGNLVLIVRIMIRVAVTLVNSKKVIVRCVRPMPPRPVYRPIRPREAGSVIDVKFVRNLAVI